MVSREENGTIKMEVYRKPTLTGQYLNYYCYCPMEHKELVGRALFKRAESHSIDLTIQCNEHQRIVKELKNNRHPMRRITLMKKKAQEKKLKKRKRKIQI